MANSLPFTVLPAVGDLFSVGGPPANVMHRITSVGTVRCDITEGLFVCEAVDAANNAVYASVAFSGSPGTTMTSAYGEIPIPLSKIRRVWQAR